MDSTSIREVNALLVDDDKQYLDLEKLKLESELKSQGIDATLETEVDPGEALETLREGKYDQSFDAVISDFDMPHMDGIELLEIIREENNDIPFILHTGKGREQVAAEAVNRGADKYIQKPRGSNGNDVYSRLAHHTVNEVEELRHKQMLHEREEMIENFPYPAYHLGPEFDILYVNQSAKQTIGVPEDEELIGEDMSVLSNYGFLSEEQIEEYKNQTHPKLLEREGQIEWTARGEIDDNSAIFLYRVQPTENGGVVGTVERVDKTDGGQEIR